MSKYIKLEHVLSLAEDGVLISNSNYDKVCKAIKSLPTIEVGEDCISKHDFWKTQVEDLRSLARLNTDKTFYLLWGAAKTIEDLSAMVRRNE